MAPEPVMIYKDLRDQIFAATPDKLGPSVFGHIPPVWGVVMDMGYASAVVTLVSLMDGTVSLYFGNGGGIIGGGQHEKVRQAGKALIAAAEGFRDVAKPTTSFPLPDVGRIGFYLLTVSGVLTAERDQKELVAGKDRLLRLFLSANDVLTELRLMEQKK